MADASHNLPIIPPGLIHGIDVCQKHMIITGPAM